MVQMPGMKKKRPERRPSEGWRSRVNGQEGMAMLEAQCPTGEQGP